MRDSRQSEAEELGRLALMLRSDQMPVQQVVAREAGVAQSLVSRARNGRLRRVTMKVRDLIEYAGGRIDAERLAAVLAATVDAEAAAGDGVDDGAAPVANAPLRYRKEALDGIRSYLDEGYDPRLVIEQLAVLRRAQRVRRPGPPSKVARA